MRAPAASPVLPRLRVRVPAVVVPTLVLFAASLALGGFATWLALDRLASPLVTIPLHVAAMFGMFVVAHDCGHHAAGRVTWFNDVLGRLATPFLTALCAFPAGRYLHLEQHRRAGESHLTPRNLRRPAWQLPLRWVFNDLWHVGTYLKRTAERPQAEVAEALGMLVLVPGTLAAVIATGHGWELVVVYLLPQRLMLALSAWWFDWFPRHLPEDAFSYHGVHSRYPSLPFYRYTEARRADRSACPVSASPPASPDVFHSLPVARLRPLTGDAVEVGFAVPEHLREEFEFTPGQHVVLRAVIDGEQVQRAYAVSSCSGELRVAVKQVPGGRMSTFLTTRVRASDRLDVLPPSGQFTLGPARTVVAIAAGVGIAPVLPMLSHALATSPRARATLLYVNRSGADTIYAGELSALVRRFEGRLRVEHFRTDERDPELRQGRAPFDRIASALAISDERYHSGPLDAARLRSLLDCRLHPAKIDEWLVCAPVDIAGLVRAQLADHGVPADGILSERFCDLPPQPEGERWAEPDGAFGMRLQFGTDRRFA
ncbi:hypothetical protein FG385_18225 [Amycolatopsis alkalitolerans]|uniref:FAD-binding FR-type domain-containing protein n=1 Tax=Amycolatopsis alkalitolerans TaxID=2547244 RepID=A0A5C4LZD6_9PSEU|nr:hypothetical protein FG385_18225 [Amycolatopsis alkalitolerans]